MEKYESAFAALKDLYPYETDFYIIAKDSNIACVQGYQINVSEALQKQIPIKISLSSLDGNCYYQCPCCKSYLQRAGTYFPNFCKNCGQRLEGVKYV